MALTIYNGIVYDQLNFMSCVFQAEEFNEAVQVVREWLPQAESELKFRPLPEDEEAIVQLIEQHEVCNI